MRSALQRAACILVLFAAVPARAEICYGSATSSGANPTAATVFTCPSAGARTLNQLALAGWRVVKLTPIAMGGTPTPQIAVQLVIQPSADRLFGNGFDP